VLAVDDLGPLADRPVLFVDLADAPLLTSARTLVPLLPCVVVGIGRPDGHLSEAEDAFDVLLTSDSDAPRPWVSTPDVDDALLYLNDAIERSPSAAVTLAQVLRAGENARVEDAILIESLAYGLLQSGPEFAAWLSDRLPKDHRSSTEPVVAVDREGDELTITLNRPDVRNAYDAAMRDALVAALDLVVEDDSIATVHLRGAGRNFCSGGDLAEFGTASDPATGHLIRTTRSGPALLSSVAGRVIAHLHGACVGAGVELPAFASRVVAKPNTTLRLPEVGMGLVPGAGGTASIPRRIGRQRTAWLALTGAELDAGTAERWGLVDAVE
jgi:hypothetical protein